MKFFYFLYAALLFVIYITLVSCGSGAGSGGDTSVNSSSSDGPVLAGAVATNEETFLGVIGSSRSDNVAKTQAASVSGTLKIIDVPWIPQMPPGECFDCYTKDGKRNLWGKNVNCGPTTFLMVDALYNKYGSALESSPVDNIKKTIDFMALNYKETYGYKPKGAPGSNEFYYGDYTSKEAMKALLMDKGDLDVMLVTTDGLQGLEREIDIAGR